MVKIDLPLAFETTKYRSPGCREKFYNCIVLKPCPCGRYPHKVQQQPVVDSLLAQQQIQKHQSLSMNRVALRACKPTPPKVSTAEMMQEQKRHTHTLTYAHVHARIHCTRSQTDTHVHAYLCAQMHTQTHKGTCTRTCIHTHTCTPTQACTNPSTRANAHAHARTHA